MLGQVVASTVGQYGLSCCSECAEKYCAIHKYISESAKHSRKFIVVVGLFWIYFKTIIGLCIVRSEYCQHIVYRV